MCGTIPVMELRLPLACAALIEQMLEGVGDAA